MTPKEKAKELVDKFARIDGYQDSIDLSKCEYEKQCALIAVEEMLDFMFLSENENSFWINYYNKVKQEIEPIMTPKEKAKEMLKTFDNIPRYAKKAVDELIYETQFEVPNIRQRWWQDVKQHIQRL